MSLLSSLRKNKQETPGADADDGKFYSRAEDEQSAAPSRKRRASGRQTGAAPVDPVLPEKKRARRRLIGALALVLAAVIGLPMVLDSEPKPLAGDIDIQIPSKEKAAPLPQPADAASTAPADSAAAAVSGGDMPAASEHGKVPAEAALDPKEEIMTPAPAAPSVTSSSKDVAVAKKEDKKPSTGPTSSAAGNTAGVTEKKTEASAQEAARARALLEGRPDPVAAPKSAEKFVVQVAALASREKVEELQARLKAAGIASFTQRIATESGDRTRIRVGPFPNREEAEKMRAKIVKLGLNGTLVPLES